ncbi:MAG: aspartate/glutamate racemase family protein [Trueperaceae bacterium]
MPPRIALLHAMRASMAPIEAAFARAWPEARLAQLLDDALPADLERAGGVDAAMKRRFVALTRTAVDAGADAVLFTCSAFGRAIEAARDAVSVPVMKPNEAMVAAAVARGAPVALLATFAPTLDSMRPEFEAEAARQRCALDLRTAHVAGALAALRAGDAERHDAAIAEAAARLGGGGTVVALAQFSMARAAERVRAATGGTVLTTPDTAVAELRRRLLAG